MVGMYSPRLSAHIASGNSTGTVWQDLNAMPGKSTPNPVKALLPISCNPAQILLAVQTSVQRL